MPAFRSCLIVFVAAAGLSSCDSSTQRPLNRMVPAAITGEPVSCIPLSAVRQSEVRDGRTIDFLTGSRRGWRSVLPAQCPNLASARAFTYSTSISQLCSTDIIRVLEQWGGRPMPGAACGLGQFTPIELAR